jgi:hypothetical protein
VYNKVVNFIYKREVGIELNKVIIKQISPFLSTTTIKKMKFSISLASIALAVSLGSSIAEAASCSSLYGQCGGK